MLRIFQELQRNLPQFTHLWVDRTPKRFTNNIWKTSFFHLMLNSNKKGGAAQNYKKKVHLLQYWWSVYPESAKKWVKGKLNKAFLHFLPNVCYFSKLKLAKNNEKPCLTCL